MMVKRADPIKAAPVMLQLYERLDRVARGSISVLLLGETGVGKEVVAEQLHARSPRAARPFLALNCAEFSEALLETELFGHEVGAFTGAAHTKPGLLEMADGGTVFLDEVGELPRNAQVKLLRTLEEREARRVGGLRPRAIDVRFVSATNRDLAADVKGGSFRSDLFFRLNGVSLVIPPLRERPSEIVPLARSFMLRFAEQLGQRATELSPEAVTELERYEWPGNIRELRNVIERAVLLAGGDGTILTEHLELLHPATVAGVPSTRAHTLRMSKVDPERDRARILDALARCAGNQTKAAKLLGISRRTFINRLETYGIARPKKPQAGMDRGSSGARGSVRAEGEGWVAQIVE